MNLQRKALLSIVRFKHRSTTIKFNKLLFKKRRESRVLRTYFRQFYRTVKVNKMMLCFKQEAKAHYVRQRLFSGFRKWKQTVKKQVKDASRFLKNLHSIQNTAICLRFLAVSTGLWDLMDLFAYCTKKRLIRRPTPFNKAIQHAIRQQLR